MKKIFTLLLSLLMILTLVGCNSNDKQEEQPISKEDTPIAEIEVTEEDIKEDTPIVGGWTDAEDSTITDELKDIFNEALKGLLGASYEPKELIATQVVNGINYKFLAEGKKTTNPITKGTYYVTVNKSATGEISLVDIETIEEKQEEVKKSTIDYTKLDYWVVFYDQFGNELQREALRYGSVPAFKGTYPEGFDSWDKELKAITGNTYIHALCHTMSHSSSSEPSPTPNPTPIDDGTIHKGDVIEITSENAGYKYYFVLKVNGNEATLVNVDYDKKSKFASDNSGEYENSLLDIACNTTFFGGLSSTLQNAIVEKTVSLNQYTFDDTNYNENTHPFKGELSSKVTLGTIDRKVYPLDIEDIEEYLGSTYSIDDVLKITNGECWLRSITTDKSWRVTDSDINVYNRSETMIVIPFPFPISSELNVRPTFVIDLTKNIEYKKKIKVDIMTLYGTPLSSMYANKGDRVVDLTVNEGDNVLSFVKKTCGSNTFYIFKEENLGEAQEYYTAAFTISGDQIEDLFSHSELVTIESLINEDMRTGEMEPDEYDGDATEWSDVKWDQVSEDYDEYMVNDVVSTFQFINDLYASNSTVYDMIINKLKAYLLTSSLRATDETKVYVVGD